METPWHILDDFNCVLNDEERSSKRGASSNFQSWISRNGLMDLGYEGAAYTWNHGVNKKTRRSAHLDRALCDYSWRRLFPAALVKHLAHSHSDHCLLLLELEDRSETRLVRRFFRFEASRILHEEFETWLKGEWMGNVQLPTMLKDLTSKLKAWNQDTFGNIFKRRRRNELRLGGVLRALARENSNFLLDLERELKKERSLILLQEEMLWIQKSCMD